MLNKIKVLVIDDSPVVRSLLKFMIESDSMMSVIGAVSGGVEALNFLSKNKPDVITTDMNMPKMDGIETIRQILRLYAIPILVVSGSCNPNMEKKVFQTLEAGALAVLAKPAGILDPNYNKLREELLQMLKVMSEVKVVRRVFSPRSNFKPTVSADVPLKEGKRDAIKAIGIGASTGGPQALHTLFSALPKNISVPILVVQHISPGFLGGLVAWLNQVSTLPVMIAQDKELALPGKIYLAPDFCHMEVGNDNKIILSKNDGGHEPCPSVARLFRSMAHVHGSHAIGVLLTGMGKDGAEELLLMKQKGAYTIAQDEDSSVIFGMPREAILLNAATRVLAIHQIADVLQLLTDPMHN